MSTETSELKDLIRVLNDGIEFYNDAIKETAGSAYQAVFQDMIRARESALARLQPLVLVREGEIEDGQTFSGQVRKVYADLLAMMKSDKSATYIAQLEELEDRTLRAIQDALKEATSADIRTALNEVHVSLQQCHNRMRSLKKAAA